MTLLFLPNTHVQIACYKHFEENIVVVKNYTEMFHAHSQYIIIYSIRQYAAMIV